MAALSTFRPYVLPHAPGAPNPVLDRALVLAAREFCEKTKAWVDEPTAVMADGTTSEFALDLPAGSELVKILRARVNGRDYDVLAYRELPEDWDAPDADSNALDRKVVLLADLTGYMVYPRPASGDTIAITQALQPVINSGSVGDFIFARYARAIGDGALADLLATAGKPYSNPDMATYRNGRFQDAIHRASNLGWRQGLSRSKSSGQLRTKKAKV